MSDIAIRAEGLSKAYTISHQASGQHRYHTLREDLVNLVQAPFRRRNGASSKETVWALKDVSFEVKRGEVLGIIGRNGAGKSTLLKILSRITRPTEGYADVYGRVGSLLEVGTGFHPELTGRENVYLSGAVLGMTRAEVRQKFDEIVAFAEIEKFLDTPVKRFSSGMYMRLAFAVAAHLDPEILLIDEVLAVGDAAFQKKCLGKMGEVAKAGRTVLFVSHDMAAIQRLCTQGILLRDGTLACESNISTLVSLYLDDLSAKSTSRLWSDVDTAPGDEVARILAVRVRQNEREVVRDQVNIQQPVEIEVEYMNLQPNKTHVVLVFSNEQGIELFTSSDNHHAFLVPTGKVKSTCVVPGNFLAEGRINVLVSLASFNPNISHLIIRDALSFMVVDHTEGDGVRGTYVNRWPGLIRPWLEWKSVSEGGTQLNSG